LPTPAPKRKAGGFGLQPRDEAANPRGAGTEERVFGCVLPQPRPSLGETLRRRRFETLLARFGATAGGEGPSA